MSYIVAGTDTGIGKTVCAALLTLVLQYRYWKPVQSGLTEKTDTETVQTLTALPDSFFIPEAYRLQAPLSPHRSAELDGVEIDISRLSLPDGADDCIIELAGGLMVPLTRDKLFIDVVRDWARPIILCARTGLGTINHTLLSIEALRRRNMVIHGLVFIGEENPDTVRTICDFSSVRQVGYIPVLPSLDSASLQQVFDRFFDKTAFLKNA